MFVSKKRFKKLERQYEDISKENEMLKKQIALFKYKEDEQLYESLSMSDESQKYRLEHSVASKFTSSTIDGLSIVYKTFEAKNPYTFGFHVHTTIFVLICYF